MAEHGRKDAGCAIILRRGLHVCIVNMEMTPQLYYVRRFAIASSHGVAEPQPEPYSDRYATTAPLATVLWLVVVTSQPQLRYAATRRQLTPYLCTAITVAKLGTLQLEQWIKE